MSLEIKKIPGDINQHPEPPSDILPKHEFTMGLIAPKGSGKTTLICNLLLFYKGYFNKIYIFSPSVKSDEKWDYIKKQPLLKENVKLKRFLAEMKKERLKKNTVVAERPESLQSIGLPEPAKFDPYIPEECFVPDVDLDMIKELMSSQQTIVDFLKDHGQTKYLADRTLCIFDDMVGSELFSAKKVNPFKTFNTNHRHLSISALLISQAYKEIGKTIRTNFTCMIIFEISNDSEIQAIYEENTIGLKFPEWLEVYNICVSEPHGFMFFNHQKQKETRIMKNFTKYIVSQK